MKVALKLETRDLEFKLLHHEANKNATLRISENSMLGSAVSGVLTPKEMRTIGEKLLALAGPAKLPKAPEPAE
jgi:hypothetical protein